MTAVDGGRPPLPCIVAPPALVGIAPLGPAMAISPKIGLATGPSGTLNDTGFDSREFARHVVCPEFMDGAREEGECADRHPPSAWVEKPADNSVKRKRDRLHA